MPTEVTICLGLRQSITVIYRRDSCARGSCETRWNIDFAARLRATGEPTAPTAIPAARYIDPPLSMRTAILIARSILFLPEDDSTPRLLQWFMSICRRRCSCFAR